MACRLCFVLPEPLHMCQDARRDARSALSRSALVSDLGAKGVLNLVPEEVKQVRSRAVRPKAKTRCPTLPCRILGAHPHQGAVVFPAHRSSAWGGAAPVTRLAMKRGVCLRDIA